MERLCWIGRVANANADLLSIIMNGHKNSLGYIRKQKTTPDKQTKKEIKINQSNQINEQLTASMNHIPLI